MIYSKKNETMAVNVILLCQLAGYVTAFILSLCITVPMSMNQDEFRGHCLLFSAGNWTESDGQFNANWASQAYCNYPIFVGVMLFLIAAIQIYRMAAFILRSTDSSFLASFFDVVGSLLMCIMTFIAGVIVTLGFKHWCNEMTKRFPSCELSAGQAIDKQDGIDTMSFYFEIGVAQFATWASWATCVGLTVFSFLKLCRYHQLENIRVSMFRERQKLIDERTPCSSLERDWSIGGAGVGGAQKPRSETQQEYLAAYDLSSDSNQ